MSEDRFERVLRSAVSALAPSEVPPALRQRVVGVTVSARPAPWVLRGWRMTGAFAGMAAVAAVAVAIAVMPLFRSPGAGSLVGTLVSQTDGRYGYEMLRPAAWTAVDLGGSAGRGYKPSSETPGDRLLLQVGNLSDAAKLANPDRETTAQWELFHRNPSLAGWTIGIEQMWQAIGIEFTVLETLPNAVIYALPSPDGSQVQLGAYAVDHGQPLVIGLSASGAYGSLDTLRADGLLSAFDAMVKSVQAIDANPSNVLPTLP